MIIYGISIIISLLIGITIGYKLSKGEKPVGNLVESFNNGIIKPVKEISSNVKNDREVQKEISKLTQIAKNIDVYDGTGKGQKKV